LQEKSLKKQFELNRYPDYDLNQVNSKLEEALSDFNKKIIVLDDDPTGIQTVQGVSVYTDWSIESIRQGFDESNTMFFILTNSRGLTAVQTTTLHSNIATNIIEVSKEKNIDFIIISRGDSTLRGHYPLETRILKETLEKFGGKSVDGEVIIPFFKEGGRFTINNIHYVADNDILVPAGETEFAKDKTFGYSSSHLGEWIEEKSGGTFKKDSVVYISLEELRSQSYSKIVDKLAGVSDFNKVVANAIDYSDVKVFVIALIKAIINGKNFLFRSAAALTKIIGGISDKPLLTKQELINSSNKNGGIVIVGSHVKKTTTQLEHLKKATHIEFVEFNVHLVLDDNAFKRELDRVIKAVEENIEKGRTVAVYTRRERFDFNTGNKEDELVVATKISDAVSSIISSLKTRPNFIIAKGGITSSDIGTKGLNVKKAMVLGQILHGIPVWLTGPESKFPNMPYVIFPGNVGNETALLEAVNIMQPDNN
jgi:uncharacterized protein YgbK (DUF1537 family)